tara:strand:- start:152 stop:523 length:372 start_codon:yes stop_codon:yes gene_type:complete
MKREGKHFAKDLYVSPLFKKSYFYAKKHFDKIYILSAKYGLVSDTQEIESYDMTLNKMGKYEIQRWSALTAKQINETLDEKDELIFMAGKNYYKYIVKYIFHKYTILMENLSIGRRLQFLNND